MTGPAFDRVLDALRADGRQVKMEGTGKARSSCPGHGGTGPNMTIMDTAERVNMFCHSHGCSTDDIMAGLNLTWQDRYHSDDRENVASYTYDNGRHVFRKRAGQKQFRQANTEAPPQLYRLAKVVEAVKAGGIIYLVEGESDVHALEAAGQVATTAPQGAGNFHKVDVAPLRGAVVAAIVDRDESGDKWARAVWSKLAGVAQSVWFGRAVEGKDASDHLTAGHGVDDFEDYPTDDFPDAGQQADDGDPEGDATGGDSPGNDGRRLRLTSAAGIKPRRVRWLLSGRFALGTLGILAGREGLGKSTLCYSFVAQVTRGEMRGEFQGQPKSVIIAATEDSWEHTIVPRLIAAGADLNRAYRIDVTNNGLPVGLVLPNDLVQLEDEARRVDAAMLLLDPLTSRLNGKLDTHKDAEVRQALEPLVALADRVGMFVLGIMHFNKSGSTDPLALVMGSKAFTAVARSVHSVVRDPDDDTERRRLFGTPKNNLGRDDLPSLGFEIESFGVPTDDGTAWTSRLVWTGEVDTTIADAVRNAAADGDDRTATQEAAGWLEDYLADKGEADSADVKKAAHAAGHSERTLQRARQKLRVSTRSDGFPRRSYWSLPTSGATRPRDHGTTGTTGTTGGPVPGGEYFNPTTTRGYGTTEGFDPSCASRASGATQTGTGTTRGGTTEGTGV